MTDYNFDKIKLALNILTEIVGKEEGRRENINIKESQIKIIKNNTKQKERGKL